MLGRATFLAIATTVVCVLALTLAASASAFIYWANSKTQTIGRAENDGSGVDDAFIHTGQLPFAVAVDASHVYWVNQKDNSIGRANIDGSGVDNSFITGILEPDGVAVNGSSIYWSTIPGPIGRANLNGTGLKAKFITAASEPCGLALDNGHVYWADDSLPPEHIGRASLDGSFLQPEYVTMEAAFPCGVAVNSANIYWADTGIFGGGTRIGRADVASGKNVDLSFIAGASTPCGLALDASSHLYWANAETSTIGRANSDGTAVDQSFIAAGGGEPCGVAVDSLASPLPATPLAPPSPTPTPVSDRRSAPHARIVGGPGKKLSRGIAKFKFEATPAAARFECKLDGRQPARCRSPKLYRRLAPGRHLFRVWAVDGAGVKEQAPSKRRFRVPAKPPV
jgi:hypothetical protein